MIGIIIYIQVCLISAQTGITNNLSSPSQLQSITVNSTTLLLYWCAPGVPPTECNHQNESLVAPYKGIISREYHIEVTDDDTEHQLSYTTHNTHLLLGNLQPNHQYTVRVAAYYYNTERGPFSSPFTVILRSSNGTEIKLTIIDNY